VRGFLAGAGESTSAGRFPAPVWSASAPFRQSYGHSSAWSTAERPAQWFDSRWEEKVGEAGVLEGVVGVGIWGEW
jgi:hypothetical protein